MKITIYELLGMIIDGIAPKKIKVTGTIYDFDEEYGFYFTKTKTGRVALGGKLDEINLIYNFNNEDNVEIIEEPQEHKIPEKLESYISCGWAGTCKDLKREDLFNDLKKIGSKINEILDYLEEIE